MTDFSTAYKKGLKLFSNMEMALKPSKRLDCEEQKFHAVDTSNLMDYVGVWNLVLAVYNSIKCST